MPYLLFIELASVLSVNIWGLILASAGTILAIITFIWRLNIYSAEKIDSKINLKADSKTVDAQFKEHSQKLITIEVEIDSVNRMFMLIQENIEKQLGLINANQIRIEQDIKEILKKI